MYFKLIQYVIEKESVEQHGHGREQRKICLIPFLPAGVEIANKGSGYWSLLRKDFLAGWIMNTESAVLINPVGVEPRKSRALQRLPKTKRLPGLIELTPYGQSILC